MHFFVVCIFQEAPLLLFRLRYILIFLSVAAVLESASARESATASDSPMGQASTVQVADAPPNPVQVAEAPTSTVQAAEAPTVLAVQTVPVSSSHCDAWTTRVLAKLASGRLNLCEVDFALKKPSVFSEVVFKALYTHEVIINFCRLNVVESLRELEGDEESDALRHFVFSAALGWYLSKEDAAYVLDLHELSVDGKLSPSNVMDKFNNNLGLIYASKLPARSLGTFFDWGAALSQGVRSLLAGELSVLKKGDSECARLSGLTEKAIGSRIQEAFEKMHDQQKPDAHLIP